MHTTRDEIEFIRSLGKNCDYNATRMNRRELLLSSQKALPLRKNWENADANLMRAVVRDELLECK